MRGAHVLFMRAVDRWIHIPGLREVLTASVNDHHVSRLIQQNRMYLPGDIFPKVPLRGSKKIRFTYLSPSTVPFVESWTLSVTNS